MNMKLQRVLLMLQYREWNAITILKYLNEMKVNSSFFAYLDVLIFISEMFGNKFHCLRGSEGFWCE